MHEMTSPAALSLQTLTDSELFPWLLDLRLPETNGGSFDIAELRSIELAPEIIALRISGLDQPGFETVIERHGQQLRGLCLWKCPRIVDFTPLEDLEHLRHLCIYWNHRATHLWNMAANPDLVALEAADLRKISDLGPLERGQGLRELWIGDKTWPKTRFDSLEPLGFLNNLVRLSVFPDRVTDGRIQPLGELHRLEELHAPSKLWTTEQLAWLRARIPATTVGGVLNASKRFEPQSNDDNDTLVMGKRKPFLHSVRDADRIARYHDAFDDLVAHFQATPEASP